jgi:type I restriction enzyme S subunit
MEAEVSSYNIESLRRMVETFGERIEVATVSELSEREVIFVEDGNHGENRPRQDEFAATGIAFLRPPDLKDGRVDFQSCSRINDAGFNRVRKGIGRRGDIILTHRATVGRIAITDDDAPEVFVTNPGTTIWRSTDPNVLDQRFLYCFMRSAAFMDQLWSQVGNNSTFDYVSLTQQRGLRVAYPPIAEQKAIAAVLGALDDKIELNRRMNATLESMARALFQSWFVDFDPVRAKLDGRQPVGLDPETSALFPDSFQDSSIGHIPSGWEVAELATIADVIDCLHTKKPERCENGQLYLQLNNIRDDGLIDITDSFFISPEDYRKWISRMEARAGDCVITNVGRVGAVGQIPEGVKAALGRNITGIRCKASFPFPTFLIECLVSESMRDEIRLKTDSGTILDALNVKSIPKLRFVRPALEIGARFEWLTRPLRRQMEQNLSASRTLATLRDTLLPKLLSGELSAADLQASGVIIR